MRWSILAILLSGGGALVGTGWQALRFVQDAKHNGGSSAQSGEPLLRPDHPLVEWLPFLESLPPELAFASPLVAIAALALVYWVMRLIGFIVTTVTVGAVIAGVAFVAYPKESAQFFSSAAATVRTVAVEQGLLEPGPDYDLPRGYTVPYQPREPRQRRSWRQPEGGQTPRVSAGPVPVVGLEASDLVEPVPEPRPVRLDDGLAEARAIMQSGSGN